MVWHGIMGIKVRHSATTTKAAHTDMHEENMRIWKLHRANSKLGNVCSKEVISCNMYLDGNMD